MYVGVRPALATICMVAASCSVPSVTLVPEDAAPGMFSDASYDAAYDAASDDAVSDDATGNGATSDGTTSEDARADTAPSSDGTTGGEASSGCPGPTPAGFTTCCGSTACVDHSGGGCNCDDCGHQACAGDMFCCFNKQGNLSCKGDLSACK
jgi:hypothetical protein